MRVSVSKPLRSDATPSKDKEQRTKQGQEGRETHRLDLLARALDARHEPLLDEPDARDAVPAEDLHDAHRRLACHSPSHDINYMVAYPLIHGKLTSESYTDESAMDPRIDALRAKITCVEDQRFSVEYHEPSKRSIGNALTVELNDGTVLDEVEIEYPVGHKRRRVEGTPLLLAKFERHIGHHFDAARQKTCVVFLSILSSD